METKIACVLLLIQAILVQSTSGVAWSPSSPPEGAQVLACDGDDVTLSWTADLGQGETVNTVEWFQQGSGSEELIALSGFGRLTVTPAFSGRVEALGNAGIRIKGVRKAESGNFSVILNAVDINGLLVRLQRSVAVDIRDGLMTVDGKLHAASGAATIFDDVTNTWKIGLTCGEFIYPDGAAPFDLEWMTPDGQRVPSTKYESGHFLLALTAPVAGGTYICGVPPANAAQACLLGNQTAQAIVTVDAVQARLMLLEAENGQLRKQVAGLAQVPQVLHNLTLQVAACKADELKAEVHQKLGNLTSMLTAGDSDVRAYAEHQLQNVTGQMAAVAAEESQQRQHLQDALATAQNHVQHDLDEYKNKSVVFGATGIVNWNHHAGEMIRWKVVHTNVGGGFDAASGVFTAPYDGEYVFAVTVAGYGKDRDVLQADIHVGGTTVAIAHAKIDGDSHGESCSTSTAVPLKAGQRVWVVNKSSSLNVVLWSYVYDNSFTGFLIK